MENKKPIKAVLGVAVLGTKKGRNTLKKFFKGKSEIASSAPGMAAVPKTLNKGGEPVKARFGDFMNTFIADDKRSVAGKSGGADSGTAGEMRSKLGKSDVVEKKKIKNYIKKKVEQGKTVIKKTKEAAKKTGTILAAPINKFHKKAEENYKKYPDKRVRIYQPRTMNKGGGMDMGAKKPLSFKEQLEKARAEGTVEKSKTSKYLKKKSRGDRINALLKTANMNKGGGMDMGQMPNTVKPRPRGNPGIVENVVGKGGDYIKDLID